VVSDFIWSSDFNLYDALAASSFNSFVKYPG
jgi:hypothetical protein